MIISRTPLRMSFAGGGSDLPAFYRTEPEACIDLFFRMAVLAKKYKKVIIALCYYAMYQACRAAVFHTHRNACLE